MFPTCSFMLSGIREHWLRPKLFKRSLKNRICLLTDVPGTQQNELMNGWMSGVTNVPGPQWLEDGVPSIHSSSPAAAWLEAALSFLLHTSHRVQKLMPPQRKDNAFSDSRSFSGPLSPCPWLCNSLDRVRVTWLDVFFVPVFSLLRDTKEESID